jgi:hypothetical protein
MKRSASCRCERNRRSESAAALKARRLCVDTCRGIGGLRADPDPRVGGERGPLARRGFPQALSVRRGNCAPVTVVEFPVAGESPGRGQAFLVAGEPGIGKSELADRLAAEAATRGAEVLSGRSWEGEGAPPYWPWAQIIRDYTDEHEGAALEAIFGAAAPYMAQIIPELRDRFPDLPAPPPLDSEVRRQDAACHDNGASRGRSDDRAARVAEPGISRRARTRCGVGR